ncbi:MAG: hypothetical protein HXJ92_01550 [candidate division SR1 bacterium]|nr:hypothetical protein [candidate division SR1 bacterium]
MELYVLDYFMNKNFKVLNCPDEIKTQLRHGDKIVYICEEKGVQKSSIGLVIGYPIKASRTVEFERAFSEEESREFLEQQDIAHKVFPSFKEKFKARFEGSKPITARYNPIGDQIYFYFYSEERYVFGDFVKELRAEIGKNLFLFQIGARDMMRLDPAAKDYAVGSDCGMLTACQSLNPLPSVEVECIGLQGVDGRDMERLKGRCGKLKCSLMYELEIYQEEVKNFPTKGSTIKCPGSNENGIVSSYNIMTREVILKTPEGAILRVPLSALESTNS